MWRTASLYSLGLFLNRTIYFEKQFICFYDYRDEFNEFFKYGYKVFQFMSVEETDVQIVNFALPCCSFDTPLRLIDNPAKFLKVHGNYFQSFKYFSKYRKNILKLFEFNPNIKRRADTLARKLFRNFSSEYRLCVHTRRDDFIELNQETKKYFADRAIAYVLEKLKTKSSNNISVILLGNDKNFIYEIDIDEQQHQIYVPGIRNRGVDICFASTYCEALLITAPTSTFAWWIGYLMPDDSEIYYYSCEKECSHIKKKDYFPPNWRPLNFDFKGNIQIDDNALY